MEDAIFALGAQLAYYNWHDYKLEDKDMYTILKNQRILGEVLTKGKSEDFINDNTSYVEKIDGKDIIIYEEEDKRLIMFYSENRAEPNENPLFANLFTGWNFIEGINHEKAYKETITELEIGKKKKEYSWMGLSKEDSGFQAFAMEKGKNILISYRGTDFGKLKDLFFEDEEFTKDMLKTNIRIFMKKIPDQVLCTIYFYEKIKEKYPDKKIYITGHSLGGGLAQFAAIYGRDKIVKTKTWNGLGVKPLYKTIIDEKERCENYLKGTENRSLSKEERVSREENIEKLKGINVLLEKIDRLDKAEQGSESRLSPEDNKILMDELGLLEDKSLESPFNELWKMRLLIKFKNMYKGLEERLINYSLSGDIVKRLSVQNGKNICVDIESKSSGEGGIGETLETWVKGGNFDWHGINNFLPFFSDSGDITVEVLRDNYLKNYLKTLFVDLKNQTPKLKKTFQISKRGDVRLSNYTPIAVLDEFMKGDIQGTVVLTDHFSYKYLLSNNILSSINKIKGKTSPYFVCDDKIGIRKVISLGAFNNCAILGGVIGKDFAMVIQMYPETQNYNFIQLNGNQISKSEYV